MFKPKLFEICIHEHSRKIGSTLRYRAQHELSSDWLILASGVKDVKFDAMNKDTAFFYCRDAYEYESEKRKLHQQIVTQLTIFNFIWSGFEIFIRELQIEKNPIEKGKFNDAIYYLSKRNEADYAIEKYHEALFSLEKLIETGTISSLKNRLNYPDWIPPFGKGIYLINKLRNMFAHGEFTFPDPDDWTLTISNEARIVNLSSRIILLSFQMLFISKYQNQPGLNFDYHDDPELEGIALVEYVSWLHISR